MNRFYKRKKVVLHCETVTPMFLGNAYQEAEWRAAPFKSLFRYWWRVTKHGLSVEMLKGEEGKIFGAAGDRDNSQKSLLDIQIIPNANAKPVKNPFPKVAFVEHPECEKQKYRVDPLLYLAGMGLVHFKKGPLYNYFEPNSSFEIKLYFPDFEEISQELKSLLGLIKAFGAIGGRSRNGWGSFRIVNASNIDLDEVNISQVMAQRLTKEWTEGLNSDYPNCLGRDNAGLLLWKTEVQENWALVMRQLADTYIHVRAKEVEGIQPLDPGNKKIQERHLLGVPLTNHPAWGNTARHASPLRFVVHKNSSGFRGFILHLPHNHSSEMRLPHYIDPRRVWGKVHSKLDKLLERATYEECLS